MGKKETALLKSPSLAEIFAEAQAAWAAVEKAKAKIEMLKAEVKQWKGELAAAEQKLAQVLGKSPTDLQGA